MLDEFFKISDRTMKTPLLFILAIFAIPVTYSRTIDNRPLWDFDAVFKNEGRWASIHNVDYSFYFPYLLDIDEFKNEYLNDLFKQSKQLNIIVNSNELNQSNQ